MDSAGTPSQDERAAPGASVTARRSGRDARCGKDVGVGRVPVHTEVFAWLGQQFRRRHPEWFDPQFYPAPTVKEQRKLTKLRQKDDVERMMALSKKADV